MAPLKPEPVADGIYRFEDSCNVYVIKKGERALAVDYGEGRWLPALASIGAPRIEHVFLTHAHADQCAGLQQGGRRPFKVHAPVGEAAFLEPRKVAAYLRGLWSGGCPANYEPLAGGLRGVAFDMGEARDFFWDDERIRFMSTPGHGANALTIFYNRGGRQLAFCGDAAHAGATVWKPFNLEWHHSFMNGPLAAWQGVFRLSGVGMDSLCPSHGPVVDDNPRGMLRRLCGKLLAFARSRDSICPGEPDDYVPSKRVCAGARRVLPNLFQFGGNGFLLRSQTGEALIVDPFSKDMETLERLLKKLGQPALTAMIASHYHYDHTDAIPYLRKKYGARAYLHPQVAAPMRGLPECDRPWLPPEPILPDELLPENGVWEWNEYRFDVAHWPGQTWWHAGYQTTIDGKKVFFGGDNFQPNSRWGGGGGYCAYNHSRFREGFHDSAALLLEWKPDLLCNGHNTYFEFRPSQFRKIQRWALQTEKVVADLCPSGNLENDYFLHHL